MKQAALFVLLSLFVLPTLAEHITDKLVVGMYEKAEITGSPIQLLSSGTPLEVLKRSEGLSQVRLADDSKGWIESSYITQEKPASMMLLEAQAELRQLKMGADAVSTVSSSELPSVKDVKMQQALTLANARIAELEKDLLNLPAAHLAEQELGELKARVARALELLTEGESASLTSLVPETKNEAVELQYQPWIMAALALVIGFAAGVGFIDYRIRKRYGGFRI